jgi:signal transduction histidine kinase
MRYVLDLTEDFFQERACTVICKFESKIELFANRYLLEILLTNLFSNALRHSEKGIQIIIETKENECMISNPGTTPLNKDAVFQRFISTSIHSPGSGLGLAISREICLASGWVLTYDFSNGRHFFTISF